MARLSRGRPGSGACSTKALAKAKVAGPEDADLAQVGQDALDECQDPAEARGA